MQLCVELKGKSSILNSFLSLQILPLIDDRGSDYQRLFPFYFLGLFLLVF